MSNTTANLNYLQITPGVQPSTDATAYHTTHYTYSDKIRFVNNMPEKSKGFRTIAFPQGQTISGVPRSIFSSEINGKTYQVIGTNTRLYSVIGGVLTNITPVDSSPIAAPNSLSTEYGLLSNNPLSTVNGSNIVTVQDANASRHRIGDIVTLSGALGLGGIAAGQLNGNRIIKSIGVNSYSFFAPVVATSSTTGGGAAVNRASGLIRMIIANSLSENDRVKISNAANTGGILAANINLEFIIRNVSGTFFDILTSGIATSSVTASGGASTQYYAPIPIGAVNESFGQGYGMGLYGAGLYGTVKVSSQGRKYPRIWYFDRYGDYIIMTPGNGSKLYYWDGSLQVAPIQIPNSPPIINYAFVSDNIIVTFGNNGIENRITTSDQNNFTVWAGTAENQVFDDNVEGAGRLIGHIPVQGLNIIATESKVYTFRYIGLPNVWEIKKLGNVGFSSSQSGFEANGVAYWQEDKNFYQWRGAGVEIMPANSQSQSTIKNYVFNNLNFSQKSKSFAWFDNENNEGSFHYPNQSSNEPNAVAKTNLSDLTWWPDTINRTAVEKPEINLTYPRMANSTGGYFQHNFGYDADIEPLQWVLTTNLRTLGKKETKMAAFIPDSTQSGDISVTIGMRQWPQSTNNINEKTYIVTPVSPRQELSQNGRFWNYTLSGSVLAQEWQMGKWAEEIQPSGDGK